MLLDFEKTKQLLEKYQIPMVESLVVSTLEQGIDFANRVGFPVVLKLLLPDNLHKVDRGLVKLNIQNQQQLEDAYKELRSFGVEGAELLLQKQIQGTELFIGMKQDNSFGWVVSFGLGGIFVEVLEDISFGVCPLSKTEVLDLIRKIKGYKVLQGYRGQKPIDINKLGEILVSVCKMAMENKEIKEIDFNPVMAQESNIFVADPKILI